MKDWVEFEDAAFDERLASDAAKIESEEDFVPWDVAREEITRDD